MSAAICGLCFQHYDSRFGHECATEAELDALTERAVKAEAECDALAVRLSEAEALVKELMWVRASDGLLLCPICRRVRHAEDCRLAAFLGRKGAP